MPTKIVFCFRSLQKVSMDHVSSFMRVLKNSVSSEDEHVPLQQKQKILFIFPYDWLTSPRSVREVRLLQNHSYEPLIISTRTKYLIQSGACVPASPKFDLSWEKAKVYHVPFLATPLVLSKLSFGSKICCVVFHLISTSVYMLWLLCLALMICLSNRVSVIHAHNTPDLTGLVACLVSRILRVPYIYEVHDLTPELYCERMNLTSNSVIFKVLKKVEWLAISNSAKNVFVSKTMQNHFELSYDLASSMGVVVYSGWSKDFLKIFRYDNSELDRLLREASLNDKFRILYLGSMESGYRRGLDILIEGTKQLVCNCHQSDVALIFVGDGDMRNRLISLTKNLRLSDHVSFKGALPRYEAYKWLRVADVTVDPLRKTASTEVAVSNKFLESMASEKVIIASDLAGHREVLKDGYNGLLFRADDPMNLAHKIERIIKARSDYLHRLGSNAGKDFHKKFCWEKQEAKILEAYAEIIQTSLMRAKTRFK